MSPVSLLPSLNFSCRNKTEPGRTTRIETKITQKKKKNMDKLFYDTSYLFPKIVCKRVQRPETKNIVLIISLVARGFWSKHIGFANTRGMASVEPNMVK